jgi:hypothetical protein
MSRQESQCSLQLFEFRLGKLKENYVESQEYFSLGRGALQKYSLIHHMLTQLESWGH